MLSWIRRSASSEKDSKLSCDESSRCEDSELSRSSEVQRNESSFPTSLVPSLLHRIRTSRSLRDVRAAMVSLIDVPDVLSRMTPEAVKSIIDVATTPPHDHEIQRLSLDLLLTAFTASKNEVEKEVNAKYLAYFMDENPGSSVLHLLIFSVLCDGDFWGKYNAVQCLILMATRNILQSRSQLLLHPEGPSLILNLLKESSNDGILRFEALVLLTLYTCPYPDCDGKASLRPECSSDVVTDPHTCWAELCKMVAFHGGFEKIFEILQEEGANNSGFSMPVADALRIVRQILIPSDCVRVLFLESQGLSFVTPYLLLLADEKTLSDVRNKGILHAIHVSVIVEALKIVYTLKSHEYHQRDTKTFVNAPRSFDSNINAILLNICKIDGLHADIYEFSIRCMYCSCFRKNDGEAVQLHDASLVDKFVTTEGSSKTLLWEKLISWILEPREEGLSEAAYELMYAILSTESIPYICLNIAQSISAIVASRGETVRFVLPGGGGCARSPATQMIAAVLDANRHEEGVVQRACVLVGLLLQRSTDARAYLTTLPWDEDLTLLRFLYQRATIILPSLGQVSQASILCLLIRWTRLLPKATAILFHEPYLIVTLFELAGPGVQKIPSSAPLLTEFLSMALLQSALVRCPDELPHTANVSRDLLHVSWAKRIGLVNYACALNAALVHYGIWYEIADGTSATLSQRSVCILDRPESVDALLEAGICGDAFSKVKQDDGNEICSFLDVVLSNHRLHRKMLDQEFLGGCKHPERDLSTRDEKMIPVFRDYQRYLHWEYKQWAERAHRAQQQLLESDEHHRRTEELTAERALLEQQEQSELNELEQCHVYLNSLKQRSLNDLSIERDLLKDAVKVQQDRIQKYRSDVVAARETLCVREQCFQFLHDDLANFTTPLQQTSDGVLATKSMKECSEDEDRTNSCERVESVGVCPFLEEDMRSLRVLLDEMNNVNSLDQSSTQRIQYTLQNVLETVRRLRKEKCELQNDIDDLLVMVGELEVRRQPSE